MKREMRGIAFATARTPLYVLLFWSLYQYARERVALLRDTTVADKTFLPRLLASLCPTQREKRFPCTAKFAGDLQASLEHSHQIKPRTHLLVIQSAVSHIIISQITTKQRNTCPITTTRNNTSQITTTTQPRCSSSSLQTLLLEWEPTRLADGQLLNTWWV